jgi:hypothetical protein
MEAGSIGLVEELVNDPWRVQRFVGCGFGSKSKAVTIG